MERFLFAVFIAIIITIFSVAITQAQTVPTISCSTNGSIFNTAYSRDDGPPLQSGFDPEWDVAIRTAPFTGSPLPNDLTFIDASVVSTAPELGLPRPLIMPTGFPITAQVAILIRVPTTTPSIVINSILILLLTPVLSSSGWIFTRIIPFGMFGLTVNRKAYARALVAKVHIYSKDFKRVAKRLAHWEQTGKLV
ncbi:hypothetical protein HED51_22675 [Ochrobactrum grignonense]|nr:hypothetical protein [Brucella grignonensis]